MGDTSSVVQEKATKIVWGLKSLPPKELVESNILKIYADVLGNRKANSVAQNEAMDKVVKVFGGMIERNFLGQLIEGFELCFHL